MLGAGTKLGPYQILGQLGAGGMGEVYRARDSRLDRDVAIKVLPERLADDATALARFEREAKAVAALSHPNILAIHDFGTHERTAFAVTELLEGETLRSRLTRAALPWRSAMKIGEAIADGLYAAHAKGIIHRDLKPENLFLTADGRVKILDFGLARVETPPSAEEVTKSYQTSLTDPGTIMGTVGYMSPEQIRGQVVDARSDLFSLGCVLYEMLTGQRAFARDTTADTMAAILHDDPPETKDSGKRIPPELDRVVRHCLEKNSEERFHSARDLAFALKAIVDDSALTTPARPTLARRVHLAVWITAALVPLGLLVTVASLLHGPSKEQGTGKASVGHNAIRSLAVLPFVYQGGDSEAEFLGDGIPMSLISSLSRVSELQVRPFGSASSFKEEAAINPASVGRKLGVQAVLRGTVHKLGDELIISPELVDVQTNSVLPSGGPYRCKLKDVFSVLEDLAPAIAVQLQPHLSSEDQIELVKRPTENREAYRLYVLGRREIEERTEAALWKSIAHFKQAIEKDPNYSLAYSGIADAYIQLGFDYLSPKEAFKEATHHATEAIRLDPALAEARVSLGTCHLLFNRDWPAAKEELDRALKLNPHYADAYHFYCHYHETLGDMGQAIAKMRRATELDPTSVVHQTELAWAYYHARDFDAAIRQYRASSAMDPNYVLTPFFLAQAFEQVSRLKDASDELNPLRAREKGWPTVLVELGYVHAASGQEDKLRIILKELKELSAHRYVSPFYMAAIFVAQGKHDEAINWLLKAADEGDPNLPLLRVEPKFDRLRSNPRYADLLRKVGFPQ
jgi:serine/threonine protein kinase/tetratricopeptide (TPR) repeat protein